jgi:16S rRNA processing protein RimM
VLPFHLASPLWRVGQRLHGVAREVADGAADRVLATPSGSFVLGGCRKQIAGGEERLLCTFEGVRDRDAADALKGLTLAVELADVPALGDDEFYHHELRGFSVVDLRGAPLGTVVGVFAGPAQDLLEVLPPPSEAAPEPETWFAPFVSAIVRTVDRQTRTITLDPPEGLVP